VEAVGEHLAAPPPPARALQPPAARRARGTCGTRHGPGGQPFEVAGDAVRLECLGRARDDAREGGDFFQQVASSGSTRTLRSTPAASTELGSRAATGRCHSSVRAPSGRRTPGFSSVWLFARSTSNTNWASAAHEEEVARRVHPGLLEQLAQGDELPSASRTAPLPRPASHRTSCTRTTW